jgi:hypothetical protein
MTSASSWVTRPYPLVDGVLHVDPLPDLQLSSVEVERLQVLEWRARQLFVLGPRRLLELSDGFEVLRYDLQTLDAGDVEPVPPLLEDAPPLVPPVQRGVAWSPQSTQGPQYPRKYFVFCRVAQRLFVLLHRFRLRRALRRPLRLRLSLGLGRLERGDQVQHEAFLQSELADDFVVVEFPAPEDDPLPLDRDVGFLGQRIAPARFSV